MRDFGPHLTIVLKEMCSRVKKDASTINFKEDDWFLKESWTEQEQEQFKLWLIDYLKNNVEARHELMNFPALKRYDQVATEFISNYGWKTKIE